jgi:hypothetical protein
MKRLAHTVVIVVTVAATAAVAQEEKPVPKDSARVAVEGCTKGVIFTAGPRTEESQGRRLDIPEGMHLRMNGPKKLISEIKAHEGSMIEITGLIKKGQFRQDGVNIGGGVRVIPGGSPTASGPRDISSTQIMIDVEGWRPAAGNCSSR